MQQRRGDSFSCVAPWLNVPPVAAAVYNKTAHIRAIFAPACLNLTVALPPTYQCSAGFLIMQILLSINKLL